MNNQPLPRWPVNVADVLADDEGESLAVFGLTWKLLLHQWRLGTLPADPERLRRLTGASAREWQRCWPQVEAKFPTVENRKSAEIGQNTTEIGRENAELGQIYVEQLRSAARKSERAKNAAEARYNPKRDISPAQGNAPSITESNAPSNASGMPIKERKGEERRVASNPPRLFMNESLKLLEELRSQKERLWSKHAVNRELPPDKREEYMELKKKISELEKALRV